MILTDDQRRWWFATHPEFSHSHKGQRNRKQANQDEHSDRVRPEQVDAYVKERLKYESDKTAIDLLNPEKQLFGSGSEYAKGFQNGATGDTDRQAWNQPSRHAPDLNLKPEDYSRLRELWEAERLKNLATKGEFKQQSYQDWLTDRLKPIIDLWPRKDDGSVDWPHNDINVKTREEIAREKSEWEQNPENRGIEWGKTVRPLGRLFGQDYYWVYKYDVKGPRIRIPFKTR
jgi:hypothetical protein